MKKVLMAVGVMGMAGAVFAWDGIPGISDGHSIFAVKLMRKDCYTNVLAVTALDAGKTCATTNGNEIVLRYSQFARGCESVEVRVKKEGEGHWSYSASATTGEGWLLEELSCPRILLRKNLGGSPKDETLYMGDVYGFLHRDPFSMRCGASLRREQPGYLGVQFMTYYNPTSMFYFAARDGESRKKRHQVDRTKEGLCFSSTLLTCGEGKVELPYKVEARRMERGDGGEYTWEDAADLYRGWAERQEWCRTKFADRKDVPEWTKDAPVYVRLFRNDYEQPERIWEWFDWFRAHCPDAPVYVCSWGWEKRGYWTGPDYFPVHTGDESYKKITAEIRKRGGHVWPWPSGYNMILNGRVWRNAETVNDREMLEKKYGHIMCRARDGGVLTVRQHWLLGGVLTGVCGATAEARRWFAEDICGGLIDRGADAIQLDQVEGGKLYPCYAKDHGHTPGSGHWMTEAYLELMREVRAAGARRGVDVAVTVEQPNEVLIPHVTALDYRDGEHGRGRTKSVFNYLYHDYVPLFQSNPVATNMAMLVRFAVDGQMPVYPRHVDDTPTPDEMKAFFLQWVKLYRGEARDLLMNGRHEKAPKLSGDGAADIAVAGYGAKGRLEAVVLGNRTGEERACSFSAFGREIAATLKPYQLLVFRR